MPKNHARITLGTTSANHALNDGLSDILYVLLPLLAETFNLSLAQVGLIRAAHKTALASFQIPAGLLAERFGERTLLAAGTAITGLAFIGLGFSTGFAALLMLLFVAGFGGAFQHPLASSIISRTYAQGGRRPALGTYNFAGDLGKFGFAGIIGLLVAAGLDWQKPVIFCGMLALAVAAAVFIVLHRVSIGERPPRPASQEAAVRSTAGWGIRDRRGFAALCSIAVIDSSTRNGFLTFIAFLLIAKGVSEEWAALALPTIFAGGMAGKLACGYLAERVGIIRTVILTEVATGGGILLILLLPDVAVYALLPFIGVALNGTSSVLYGTIGDLVESDRQPRAFGLFYTLGSTCGIVAPLAYGLLGDRIGIVPTLAVVGTLVFLTVPLSLVLRPSISAIRAPA